MAIHLKSCLYFLETAWHTLKNFQPVLMKVYFRAGLKELAKDSGYRGSTFSSLENNSNFKRTHNFLLQVWEALYWEMFQAYCTTYVSTNISDVLAAARCILSTSISENHPPQQVMKRIRGLIEDTSVHTNLYNSLNNSQNVMTQGSFGRNLWCEIVMHTLAYIGLSRMFLRQYPRRVQHLASTSYWSFYNPWTSTTISIQCWRSWC